MDKSQLDLMFPKHTDFRYNGGSYSGLNTTHVLEYGDGTYLHKQGVACHATTMYNDPEGKKLVCVHTSLFHSGDTELAKRWFNWVFSQDSPWAAAAKDCTITYHNNGVPRYVSLPACTYDSCPGGVFMNILHQSRAAWEQMGMLKLWAKYQDDYGLSPERALCYATPFVLNADGKTCKRQRPTHKFMSHDHILDVTALEQKKPKLDSSNSFMFSERRPTSINVMWQTKKLFPSVPYRDLVEGKKITKSTYKSRFPYLQSAYKINHNAGYNIPVDNMKNWMDEIYEGL